MVAEPAVNVVTTPAEETVAIVLLDVVHDTTCPVIVESRWSFTVATSVSVPPAVTLALGGVTRTVVTVGTNVAGEVLPPPEQATRVWLIRMAAIVACLADAASTVRNFLKWCLDGDTCDSAINGIS